MFTIDSTVLDGAVRISEFQAAGKVFVGPGVVCTSLSSIPFKATKAGKAVEYMGGPMVSAGIDIGPGSANVTVRGQLRCSGAVLTAPLEGAAFWNTDSTWASGSGTSKVGYYGYTGSGWIKLYGPA